MQIEILSRVFTRGSLKSELRRIRDSYQPGDFITDPERLSFLNECLAQGNIANDRPIEAADVRWFIALHDNLSHDSKCFGILRPDNTVDYPSLDRLSGKKKPPLRPQDAARHDINYQIRRFKADRCGAKGIFSCEDCGFACDDVREFEAHHNSIPFTELWDSFVSVSGLIEAEVEVVKRKPEKLGQEHNAFGLPWPIDFAWRAFHHKHAQLKLLCRECHDNLTYARPAGEPA